MIDHEEPDIQEMGKMEMDDLDEKIEAMEEEIKLMLLPKDPEDQKDVVMEIRAGTGGDEAAIYAGDLTRMDSKYFESKGWTHDIYNINDGNSGGYKKQEM